MKIFTIIQDEHNGIYSGSYFTAWPCKYQDIPVDVFGNHVICSKWWDSNKYSLVGKGNNPEGALSDLKEKLRSSNSSVRFVVNGNTLVGVLDRKLRQQCRVL